MPLHRSMSSVRAARPCVEQAAATAMPSFSFPWSQLVAGASRRSAAPGSQFVELSARGRARIRALSFRAGPSISGRSSRKSGSSDWPGRSACLGSRFWLLPLVGRGAWSRAREA